jgi:CRP-like cAMP-binding protein
VQSIHPQSYLAGHRLFGELEARHIEVLAAHAAGQRFGAGATVFRQGTEARCCHVILEGTVSLEVVSPHGRALTIQTLGSDEILGWSWLFPPWRWHFDARALTATETLTLDGPRVREACDRDPVLGYALMKQLSGVIHQRMQAARMQLIDLYGPVASPAGG